MWTSRLLKLTNGPGKFLFKIDTDTGFHRRFKYIPNYPAFGSLFKFASEIPYIQGGMIGFSRETAETLLKNNTFRCDEFKKRWANKDFPDWHMMRAAYSSPLTDDAAFGWALLMENIRPEHWPEIKIRPIGFMDNPLNMWAVTHPCKDGHL
jgi:hypothetical protein